MYATYLLWLILPFRGRTMHQHQTWLYCGWLPLSNLIRPRNRFSHGWRSYSDIQTRNILERWCQKSLQERGLLWLTDGPLHWLLSDRPTDENRNTASDPTFLTWCRSFLTKLWFASAILKANRLMSPGDNASRSMQLQRWWRHQCCSAAHGPTYQIKADELKIFLMYWFGGFGRI